jgi:hypothetical protein
MHGERNNRLHRFLLALKAKARKRRLGENAASARLIVSFPALAFANGDS